MERGRTCGASFRFSLGLGMYAAGWIADAPAFKWIGSGLALGGVVAYVVFATTFGGEAFRLIAAVGILALGLALTVGGPPIGSAASLRPDGDHISPSYGSWGIRSGLSLR